MSTMKRARSAKMSMYSVGDDVVIVAGMPFGEAGTTNLLHVARIMKAGDKPV